MKKILGIILIMFILAGGSGCTMEKQNSQITVDVMLNYINDKYPDDNFTFKSLSGGYAGSNSKKIIVQSEKYPDQPVYVICTDSAIFTDTYLHVKFEEQTYNYLRNTLSEEFGSDIYVSYSPSNTSVVTDTDSYTTFEDYIANPDVFINFCAIVHGNVVDEEASLEVIKNLFKDSVVYGNIYYIDESVVLSGDEGSVNAENILKNSTYNKRLLFVKDAPDKYSITEWTDGK